MLLLCGLHFLKKKTGPISFGNVNCQSVRNKGPCISDIVSTQSLNIL